MNTNPQSKSRTYGILASGFFHGLFLAGCLYLDARPAAHDPSIKEQPISARHLRATASTPPPGKS